MLWLAATFLLFLLIELLPGDAFSSQITKLGVERVENLRKEAGLNRPVIARYVSWLTGFLTGNVGNTYLTKMSVAKLLAVPFMSSFTLMGIVLLALLTITLPLAVFAGFSKGKLSALLKRIAVIVSSVPEFITTLICMMIFCMTLKIFPVISAPGPGKTVWENPICLAMPALCLYLVCTASMFRYLAFSVEIYANTCSVKEALLAGLPKWRVLFVHLMPQAIASIGQVFASTVPYLLGGSIIIESILSFPGLGTSLIQAVASRESNLIMAITSFLILVSIIAYIIADALGYSLKEKL